MNGRFGIGVAAMIISRELNLPISNVRGAGVIRGHPRWPVKTARTHAASGVNGRKMNYRLYAARSPRANLHLAWRGPARPGPGPGPGRGLSAGPAPRRRVAPLRTFGNGINCPLCVCRGDAAAARLFIPMPAGSFMAEN